MDPTGQFDPQQEGKGGRLIWVAFGQKGAGNLPITPEIRHFSGIFRNGGHFPDNQSITSARAVTTPPRAVVLAGGWPWRRSASDWTATVVRHGLINERPRSLEGEADFGRGYREA